MSATPESLETAAIPIIPPHPAHPEPASEPDAAAVTGGAEAANLAFFALALGVAGALLGVTVIWFVAAIPVGIAAVVTGAVALRSREVGPHRSRAVLGTVLGIVAVLLGILSALLLPVVADKADAALTRVRDDMTAQVDGVNSSLASDVDRMNGTVTREMRELERQNRLALREFEQTTGAQMRRLERRLAASEKNFPVQQKVDFDRLAQQLRRELATLDTSVHGADSATQATIAAMATRLLTLEAELGLAPPAAGAESPPVATTGGR